MGPDGAWIGGSQHGDGSINCFYEVRGRRRAHEIRCLTALIKETRDTRVV